MRDFFIAFKEGNKDTEFRLYGPRWNEKTCMVGRRVVLSLGYGTQARLYGKIKSFRKVPSLQCSALLLLIATYSMDKLEGADIAEIGIEIEKPNKV